MGVHTYKERKKLVVHSFFKNHFLYLNKSYKETELKEKAAQFHKTYSRRVFPHIESEI